MASKKYTLLVILAFALAIEGSAQLGGAPDYRDSSKISSKKMGQFNEWKSGSSKQLVMWQMGIYGGVMSINGDCPPGTVGIGNIFPGYNFGLTFRKALGYVGSVRLGLGYGQVKGLDYRKNANFSNSPALDVYRLPRSVGAPQNAVGPGFYVHNFKTNIISPQADFIFSLNNIAFHRMRSNWNFYVLIGYQPTVYKTAIDARSGEAPSTIPGVAGTPYNYASLVQNNPNFFNRPRKDIRKDLWDNFFDKTFESSPLLNDRSQNFDKSGLGKYNFRHSVSTGAGAELRIGYRTSLSFEFKWIFTQDDYIDGWVFQRDGAAINSASVLTPAKDNIIVGNVSFNYNIF
jgi:hypothetical protein